MLPFRHSVLSAVALAAGLALATPVFAAGDTAPAQTKSSEAKSGAGKPQRLEAHSQAGVEKRIADLHAKFRITQAQEPAWNSFAQVMRDNAKTYENLVKARFDNMASMNAVQDLQSFQQLAQAHSEGLTKLTAAFQTVYDSMSPEQKKNADQVFHQYAQRSAQHHHGKAAKKSAS